MCWRPGGSGLTHLEESKTSAFGFMYRDNNIAAWDLFYVHDFMSNLWPSAQLSIKTTFVVTWDQLDIDMHMCENVEILSISVC